MKTMSDMYKCCGAYGPEDFNNQGDIKNCCSNEPQQSGCGRKSNNVVRQVFDLAFVLPNSIVLAFEFIVVLMASFLVYNSIKKKNKITDEHEFNKKVKQ